jgi:hypothetical protein
MTFSDIYLVIMVCFAFTTIERAADAQGRAAQGALRRRALSGHRRDATMHRTSFQDAYCPIARSLERVGEWWSILILRDAFYGMTRFDEFQKSLEIAPNMLSRRLRGWSKPACWRSAVQREAAALRILPDRARARFPAGDAGPCWHGATAISRPRANM